MGIVVPIQGVADDAPNQCPEMPCSLDQAHETVTFMIRTGKTGRDPLAVLRALRGRLHRRLRRARCRRSATWTASCTWSEPTAMPEPPHFRRILILWAALSIIATPIVVLVFAPEPAAGQRRQRGVGAGDGQHGPARHRDADRGAADRLLRLRADRLPPARGRARGGGRDPWEPRHPDDLAGRRPR